MTNLEYYKDELKNIIRTSERCSLEWEVVGNAFAKFLKNKNAIYPIFINGLAENAIDWLLEEHKEKIKLTEFEHDVLKAFTKFPTYVEDDRIDNYIALQDLSSAGWFQNVDENLSIKEILDNCEIVD